MLIIFVSCRLFSSLFFFSSRRRHTRYLGDWSSDVCSSDLEVRGRRRRTGLPGHPAERQLCPPLRQAGHVHLPLHAASLHEGRSRREMTDDLDRLFERLVSVLADDAPGRLAVPFPAAEVYERLVPYRSNRSILRVATHQDYEMAVLRLLAGERGYASLEPAEVQDALRREAGESNPDTTLFRQFPDAILSLNRLAAERFLRGDRVYAPPSPLPLPPPPQSLDAADREEDRNEKPPLAGAAFELAEQSETARQCPYCGETLPGSRKVNFCPQCGQPPSGELRCPACGGEMDVGGRYCVSCGRATGFE